MNKFFNRKQISNILFVLVVVLMLYPPTREWFMRQIAFAPSVTSAEKVEKIDTYNWSLSGLNTSDLDFNNEKGNVVFVNFWATWCPPCRAEMPMIQELYNDYKDKVTFIFVTNENASTVSDYFEKDGFNLPAYNPVSAPPRKLSETNSIPATYLIDKEGNILISKVGAANWNSKKVRKLLDELIQK